MNRVLAIDYGGKRVGLALSDVLKIIAKPFRTIYKKSDEDLIFQIKDIIQEFNVEEIIVGLPLTMKGTYSEQTNKVVAFVELLRNNTNIAIKTYDERLSSIEAKKSLIKQGIKTGDNKDEIDKTAAALFLQSYLNRYAAK